MIIMRIWLHIILFAFTTTLAEAQQTFIVPGCSAKYDVTFSVHCTVATCGGAGLVRLLKKGTDSVTYQFPIQDFVFELHKPLETLLRESTTGTLLTVRDYHSPVHCEDYNFDGFEDIAIPNGWADAPNEDRATFDIYLFNPAQKLYVLNKELSDLQHQSTAIVGVNKERKRLIFYAKEGCCWNTTSEYVWTAKRLRIVYEWAMDKSGGYEDVVETTYTLVKGKWVRRVKKYINRYQ